MKKIVCLLAFATLAASLPADEIRLNLDESPDRVGTYYIADRENSGEVTGPQHGRVLCIDQKGFPMHVGDWATADTPGYMVKYFLLFHLPPLDGKKLTHATLRMYLSQIRHDAMEKPLSPLSLFHADTWQDANWLTDSEFHGLKTLHFSDSDLFSKKIALCEPDTKPGFIETDVTAMIASDYRRDREPVAAFRMEMADHENCDITDAFGNSYNFWGTMLEIPDRVPTLVLSFE